MSALRQRTSCCSESGSKKARKHPSRPRKAAFWDLVESIILVMPREDIEKMMIEVKALVRRVRLRKYVRWTP